MNSRDSNKLTDWPNLALAIFRSLPWPSFVEVGRVKFPQPVVFEENCSLKLFNCEDRRQMIMIER